METSHREWKKAQTRDALAAGAAALFAARGFDHVTIDEIAAHAGVSRRTFFRYFPSKELVVFPHHHDRLERFRAALAHAGALAHGFELLRLACRATAGELALARDELLLQSTLIDGSPALIAKERELDAEWEEAIVDALREDGVVTTRSRVIGAIVMGAIRGTIRQWLAGGAAVDLVELGEQAMDLLGSGLQSRPNYLRRTAS